VPRTTADGVALYYETAGEGETVTFVGEAGYGAWQWGWQHDALVGPFETLVWDLRGTGRSECPPGPYDVDRLAADLEAVLADSDTPRTHLVGAGLGGMVSLEYARRYGRARSLTLFGAVPDGATVDGSAMRALYAPPDDPAAIRSSLDGALTDTYRAEQPAVVDRICQWRADEDADRGEFEAQLAAMLGFDAGPLYEQTLPTLVCHGVDDPVVPLEAGRRLAQALPRGRFEPVEGRRLHFIEHSRAVSDRLVAFLDEV